MQPGHIALETDGRPASEAATVRTVALILASAVGYYLATQSAWLLSFPDSKVSLFSFPNAILVSILLLVPTRHWWAYTLSAVFAHFIFWYATLRLFVDRFREYRVESLGLGTGQIINIAMAATGLLLLLYCHGRHKTQTPAPQPPARDPGPPSMLQRAMLTLILLFCRLLPTVSVAESKAVLPGSHPRGGHHG